MKLKFLSTQVEYQIVERKVIDGQVYLVIKNDLTQKMIPVRMLKSFISNKLAEVYV